MAVKKRGSKKTVATKKRKKAAAAPAKKRTTTKTSSGCTPKRETSSKKVIIINPSSIEKGGKMSKRRKSSHKRRKSTRLSGKFTRRAKGTIGTVKNSAMLAATGTAAAILSTMLTAKIPIGDARIKAFMPFLAGIGVTMFAKGKKASLMTNIANGMFIASGLAVVKQFAPNFALAGENEMYNQLTHRSLLGLPQDMAGLPMDTSYAPEAEETY